MDAPTPGKWVSGKNLVGTWDVAAETDESPMTRVACGATEADARLIAAAPRLLKSVLWYAQDGQPCPNCGINATKAVNRCVACDWKPVSVADALAIVGVDD